jgi:GT2 family glycosyltransferase
VRGVTYGTFASDESGHPYPARAQVERDLTAMVACGVNSVRVYTVPPTWLLDAAHARGLRVMVGVAWEQHVAFLESTKQARWISEDVRRQIAPIAGHPALLCHAIGNEIPAPIVRWHGARRIEAFLELLATVARSEDPGTLVTYVNYPSTEYLELPFVDIVSFNVFLESTERFEAYVSRLHNLAGDRPLLVTEIGLDSARNGERAQARLVGAQLPTAFAEGCAGAFVFSWTDEWHRGDEAVEGWSFGVTDGDRRPKPSLWAMRRTYVNVPARHQDGLPRVSVIVCTRNGAATLDDCLTGIGRLDYPDFETIVVDDGSTDDTASLASRFPVELVSTPHRGLGAARNTGLAAATGEIVAFVDDDAIPDRDWLRFLVARLLEKDHVGVGGPNVAPPGDSVVAAAVAHAPGGPTHVLLSDRIAEHIPGCNMAFWKVSLDSVGGFDPRFRIAGDDVDICWRLQEQGWTLGFSPSAMVWHRPRGRIRAYLRQQREYGRAEALLERKWPDKYNRGGHLAWAGRVYASAAHQPLSGRRRIHYGRWGENLFQSVYERGPSTPGLLPLMPEWYLLLAVFAGLAAYDTVHSSIFPSLPGPLSVSSALLALAVGALLVQALRSGFASIRHDPAHAHPAGLLAVLTAGLFVLQPVARLSGRLRNGLTPWRRRGALRIGAPWPRQIVVWSERAQPARERLLAVEAHLRPNCMTAVRGGEYDRWDIHARLGPLAAARLRMTIEEHGRGRQLLRFRVWPRWSAGLVVVLVLLLAFAAAALRRHDLLSAALLGVGAIGLGLRAVQECGASMAAVAAAVQSLELMDLLQPAVSVHTTTEPDAIEHDSEQHKPASERRLTLAASSIEGTEDGG